MLDTVLWVMGALVLAGVVLYALRRGSKSTTYVKPERNLKDGEATEADIEEDLQHLIHQVKRKLKKELADGGG